MSTQTDISPPSKADPAFTSILCGVDGSRPSLEAARQAALLAGSDTALSYVAVTWEQGTGATSVATVGHKRAEAFLRRARDDARELGAVPEIIQCAGRNPAERLIELAHEHDLLVVGIHGHSRAGGIMIGSTATALLHRSPIPVLVARPPAGDIAFPDRILIANDGSARSYEAATFASQIALRHGADVGLVSAYDHGATPVSLSDVAATVRLATQAGPARFGEEGPVPRVVTTAALEFGATLIVTGSRGLTGVAAVGSSSERIAHAAPCSVMVLRHSPTG
jgi:nucleotide-binding universal stress UspA family protein